MIFPNQKKKRVSLCLVPSIFICNSNCCLLFAVVSLAYVYDFLHTHVDCLLGMSIGPLQGTAAVHEVSIQPDHVGIIFPDPFQETLCCSGGIEAMIVENPVQRAMDSEIQIVSVFYFFPHIHDLGRGQRFSVVSLPTPTPPPTPTTVPSQTLRPLSTTPTLSRWLSPPQAVMSLRTDRVRPPSPLSFTRRVRKSTLMVKALTLGRSTTRMVRSTPLGVQAVLRRAKPSRYPTPMLRPRQPLW